MAIILEKQTFATVNSLKVVEMILSKIWKLYRAPILLWMISPTKYFLCLINPLTHFKPVFHLCWNQVVGLHAEYPSLLAINLVKMENIDFSNRPHVGYLIKDSCLGASYTKSAPCLMWCGYIFCRLEICILFVTWPYKTSLLRYHAYLWVRTPRSMSPPWKLWWS